MAAALSAGEINTVLADRVVEWTREWKLQRYEKVLLEMRPVLVCHLEARFGPLSPEAHQRLEETSSVEALMEMIGRVPVAQSLDELGLG